MRITGTPSYPDLSDALLHLKSLLNVAEGERRPLLEKWLHSLEKVHEEMRKLETIERFSSALTRPAAGGRSSEGGKQAGSVPRRGRGRPPKLATLVTKKS